MLKSLMFWRTLEVEYPVYESFPDPRYRTRAEEGLLRSRPDYYLDVEGRVGCTTCGGNCGQCSEELAGGAASMQSLVDNLYSEPKPYSEKEQARIRDWLAQWDQSLEKSDA